MIVLVTGGRSYTNRDELFAALDAIHAETPITLVISGACVDDKEEGTMRGADWLAICWAVSREVDFNGRPARWMKDGHPQAGPMRNERQAGELDRLGDERGERVLVLRTEGGSGTANMVKQAKSYGIEVREVKP